METASLNNPLERVIFAFNVKILPEAKEELTNTDVTVFNEDVIYTIIENYDIWQAKKKEELEKKRREDYTHPGMIKFLPEYVFRVSHPAVIGVRVLGGRIKVDMKLIDQEGKSIGSIKGLQLDNKSIAEALQGAEVAISKVVSLSEGKLMEEISFLPICLRVMQRNYVLWMSLMKMKKMC